MTFNEWLNRPVYKAQVHTAKLAAALLGLPDGPIATSGWHPIMLFRLLPPYRCEASLRLRKTVADMVRQQRRQGTYKLAKVK